MAHSTLDSQQGAICLDDAAAAVVVERRVHSHRLRLHTSPSSARKKKSGSRPAFHSRLRASEGGKTVYSHLRNED